MKIDRRCFLSLGIGAAAGTVLSPLPWKSMDDSSIWSQNWPWTPVPPDGEATHEDSTCTLCPGGCGITIRKIDNRVIKIEGRKGHPVNGGGICSLGLSGAQLLYSPTRLKGPMMKVNGTFQKISWDEAISAVAEKLIDLRLQGKSHTVACISGSPRGTVPNLFKRFLDVYGSPNFLYPSSFEDSYAQLSKKTHGQKALPGFDFENADYILSFGSGIIEGWGSPVRMSRANSNWKSRHVKLVQVEPRLSNTAAKSDKWLPIKPGTEAVLALGIAYVILRESLYNQDFINNRTVGFPEWREGVLETYHPARVSGITGIDLKTINTIGLEFARAGKPLAVCGRGEGRTSEGMAEIAAILALNALVGNIDRQGGAFAVPEPDYITWPEFTLDETAARGLNQKRIDDAGSNQYPDAESLLHRLPGAILSGNKEPVNAIFITNANPCYTLHDTKTVIKALKQVPFKVSFSTYMDETAALADLILPNHSYLERYEDVPVTAGLSKSMVGLTIPVVAPQLNTKNTGDVILSLAKAMKGSISEAFPWENYSDCLKTVLGKYWNPLQNNGYVEIPPTSLPGKTAWFVFQVPGKTFPVDLEGDEKTLPLILIPNDSMRLSAGAVGSPPFLMKTVSETVLKENDTLVQVNPNTAKKYGLTENRYALLKTPIGVKKVKLYLSQGIGEGIISFSRGLGHTAYDRYLADKGVNFNELIGPVEDPASGLDVAWGIRASLTKV